MNVIISQNKVLEIKQDINKLKASAEIIYAAEEEKSLFVDWRGGGRLFNALLFISL